MDDELSNSYTSSIKTSMRKRTPSTISLKSESIDEENYYGDIDNSSVSSLFSESSGAESKLDELFRDHSDDEIDSEIKELFRDNLECVNECNCPDIDIVDNDYTDYEIINESKCIPIKNRYRKQTWYEYFRKLYMVTVILIISIVVYFYYSYSKRKDNIVSKL